MGRFISTTGTASPTLTERSSAYTASSNDRILADTSSAAFTITLPAVANVMDGDQIQIIDINSNFATNNCTVGRNGHNINGTAEDLILDLDGIICTLLYTGATNGWVITST